MISVKDNKIYEELNDIKQKKESLQNILHIKYKIMKKIGSVFKMHVIKLNKLLAYNKTRAFEIERKITKKHKLFTHEEFQVNDGKFRLL